MSRKQLNRRAPQVEAILRLVERADLIDDPNLQKIAATATISDSTYLQRRLEKVLSVNALQRKAHPFDDALSLAPDSGDQLTLGTTITGSRYNLHETDLTQHKLVIGQSGAGKTTLFYNLMDDLSVSFWAFDLKQDYRHLAQNMDDLVVLPWPRLRFNPLKPPNGVSPRRWAQVFTEIFGHATALLSGSKNHLMKKVMELYHIYDTSLDGNGPFPSLHELQVFVEQDPINYVRKTSNYRDRVLNRLEAMTLTAGTVFNCSQGYPIEELLKRNVVFEFDGLGNDLQNFLMEILFAYVYEYRVAQNQRGGTLRHVFFLDEGKRVFSVYKERQDAAGIPAIDALTAMMREFGEGLVVADQEATKLTDSIKANTYTKVLLPTGDAKQFEEMTSSMHLTERQEDLAATLGIGEAIVQTGNDEPVPVKLARYDLEKTVTDEDLEAHQREEWNQLSFEPRTTVPAFEDAIQNPNNAEESEKSIETKGDPDISDAASRLLHDVVEHPFAPLTNRYNRLSNAYQGNRAKNELVDAGFVIERTVRVKPEKRKLLQLTERGREYLDDQEVEVEREGRGGIVHRFWQHRIKDLFEEQGWTPKLELFDADVYVNLGNAELAIEIAMENTAREADHVKEHLETGFDHIWVVCRNKEVRDGISEQLEERGVSAERVSFRLFSDFSNSSESQLEELGRFGAAEREGELGETD